MRLGLSSLSGLWTGNACLAFLVRSGQRDLFEVVGLVMELHRDVLERGSVLARVVGTKKQLASRWEHCT
jgi:hypothetical protein